jgi:hypothetical protein
MYKIMFMLFVAELLFNTSLFLLLITIHPKISVQRSWKVMVPALIVGVLNAALLVLAQIPLHPIGYFILSILYRTAVSTLVIKFANDFFPVVKSKSLPPILYVALITGAIGSAATYYITAAKL